MLDLIFSGLAEIVGEALDGLIATFMPLLDFNFNTFNSTFPYAAETYSLIQSIAMAIALLIATIQLVPFFFGGSRKNESPIRILMSAAIAVAAIYYGNYIFTAIMDFAQRPYDALRLSNTSANWGLNISSIISDAMYQVSILLYIILIIAMGIAFLKLMLEVIERYVFLFVMIYLSPLVSATLASKETSGVFWKFVSMFIAQCTLFVLNIWFLKMVVSMFQNLSQSPFLLLGLIMGYAMLRIAAKFDSYLNQLGLKAAAVGMGNELLAAGMMAMTMGSGRLGGKSIAGSNEKGGVLGIADKISQGFGKISPISGVSQGVSNAFGGLFKSGQQAWGAAMDAARGEGNVIEKMKAGFNAGTKSFGDTFKNNQHDAWMKTKDGSLWARGTNNKDSNNLMESMSNGDGALSPFQLYDLANHSYLADQMVDGFTDTQECANSEVVAAMSQGIGLDKVDENAQEMLDVGYGNVAAENTEYTADSSGIHAQYEKDGWQHDWQVKTADQYNQLTPQQQQAYTAFKSDNGRQYYYAHNRTRAQSQYQKDAAALDSKVQGFAANPQENPLSMSECQKVFKNKELTNSMMAQMAQNGTSIHIEPGTPTPLNQYAAVMLENLNLNGVPAAERNAAAMAVLSGNARFHQDGRGWTCDYNASANEGRRITMLSPSAIAGTNAPSVGSAPRYDVDYLANRGYTHNTMGDNSYYTLLEKQLPPNNSDRSENDLF